MLGAYMIELIPAPVGAQEVSIPLFAAPAVCGFPSPATDYIEKRLDLNQMCIRNPSATYYARAKGASMQAYHINDGDILVVDRSIEAKHNSIVVAAIDGEFTVKKLQTSPAVCLLSGNPDYPPIYPREGQTLDTFGVVTYVVHRME